MPVAEPDPEGNKHDADDEREADRLPKKKDPEDGGERGIKGQEDSHPRCGCVLEGPEPEQIPDGASDPDESNAPLPAGRQRKGPSEEPFEECGAQKDGDNRRQRVRRDRECAVPGEVRTVAKGADGGEQGCQERGSLASPEKPPTGRERVPPERHRNSDDREHRAHRPDS